MELIEYIYASGKVVHLILVPVLREISAMFFAAAISKDCNARKNGSSTLWGIFTLIMPTLFGIIYIIYSRILIKRKANTIEEKRKIKSACRLTIIGALFYTLSIIAAITAIIITLSSDIALSSN